MEKKKIEISVAEKDELVGMPVSELHKRLADTTDCIANILEEKKFDAHLNEIKTQVRELNGEYNDRVALACAKRDYIISVLKNK